MEPASQLVFTEECNERGNGWRVCALALLLDAVHPLYKPQGYRVELLSFGNRVVGIEVAVERCTKSLGGPGTDADPHTVKATEDGVESEFY